MIKFTAGFEVTLRCHECGKELGATMRNYNKRHAHGPIMVRPCRQYMEEARRRGFDEGYDSRAKGEGSA